MTHHYARLIVVATATVSFSTPITAQQEQAPPTTLEALVETIGGSLRQNEQGEVEMVYLAGTPITDAGLAHLTGLIGVGCSLEVGGSQVTDAGVAELRKALPNCNISNGEPIAPPPPPQ